MNRLVTNDELGCWGRVERQSTNVSVMLVWEIAQYDEKVGELERETDD